MKTHNQIKMDLNQSKLTKTEWTNIEVPVSDNEKTVLKLIMDGYADTNIQYNNNKSLISTIKIAYNKEIEYHLYKDYFEAPIKKMVDKYCPSLGQGSSSSKSKIKHIKGGDAIRLAQLAKTIDSLRAQIFEFTLLEFCEKMLASFASAKLVTKTKEYAMHLYTLIQFRKSSILNINQFVLDFVNGSINYILPQVSPLDVFRNSHEYIEKNRYILAYEDMALYPHQKQLFSTFAKPDLGATLVLYTAPTGTGKTLSPLGLSSQYKIIFVCVARHVGLALAKSAISMEKKTAFAFGCQTASDIRLHYFSASTYTKHWKSGGIGKVDNSDGALVEIMICDVQSYLTAMHYMLAFNRESSIITYWDEPTITMDYAEHPLHETIHRNWTENQISKIVLSCATLPKECEIAATLTDFRLRFANQNPVIYTVTSYDCRKTISLLNSAGKCVLPHLLFPNYSDLLACAEHCSSNKTLLRYFDLSEIVRFVDYVAPSDLETHFPTISAITMNSIKLYYLDLLQKLDAERWPEIYEYMTRTQRAKFGTQEAISKALSVDSSHPSLSKVGGGGPLVRTQSVMSEPKVEIKPAANPYAGISITTFDACTLTDGPTLYLAEDVDKIGKFCAIQARIPPAALAAIMDAIKDNNVIQGRLDILQKSLEDEIAKEEMKEIDGDDEYKGATSRKSGKASKEMTSPAIRQLMEKIDAMTAHIKTVNIDSVYVPNTRQHQALWNSRELVKNAFTSNIEEDHIKEVMALDVDTTMKMLLLLGIGVFIKDQNIQYMELIKKLAYEQSLYVIIASSDYIYGTNYQFAHGFVGKDLTHMTQQKTIQALGRIGRNNIQQEYTVRFRNDELLANLFRPIEQNLEAVNMSELFCS